MVQDVLSGWRPVTMHVWIRNTDFRCGSINDSRRTSINTSFFPFPVPLGLQALPLGLLDCACLQAELTSSFKRRVALHTRLINEISATLTDPTLGLCNGPAHKAGLSVKSLVW